MNTRQIVTNAASNYGRMAVGVVTTLLLTPLVLHKLGPEAYGLWALTLAVAGYFSLVDLGVTSASIRYVSHYRALQDWPNLNKTIGSTLICYVGMSIVSLDAAFIVAGFASHLFHVTPGHMFVLRLMIINIGLISVIGFASVMPTQCVIAAQRQDALNGWQLAVQVLVAIATAVGLMLGAGLLLLAALQLFSAAANGLAGYVLSRRYLPQAQFVPGWDKDQGKLVVSYAGYAALIALAGRVIYYTDTLVIATFISVAAVAGYAVALKIVEFMRSLVGSGVSVLGTFASEQNALDNNEALGRMWSEGTKWSLVITLPMTIVFVAAGRELVSAWVGPQYALAGVVLAWLAVGQVFDQAQAASHQVLMNTGRHQLMAWLMVGEAVANLSLSIWLLHLYGVVGVAIGTSIPLVARCVFFYLLYMPRVTGLPLRDYLRQAVLPPLWTALPSLFLVLIFRNAGLLHNRADVLLLLGAVALLTAIAAYRFCLNRSHRTSIRRALSGRFQKKVARASA